MGAFDRLMWWPEWCPYCGEPWFVSFALEGQVNLCAHCSGFFVCTGKGVAERLSDSEVAALPAGIQMRARAAIRAEREAFL